MHEPCIFMRKGSLVKLTAEYVKSKMLRESMKQGHDWWHVYRVWRISVAIAKKERGADIDIVQLGALLHDISDWKFSNGDESAGERATTAWLKKAGADPDTIRKVSYIVRNVSFKGAGVKDNMKTLEGKIVQDADRIDAIGAIGIARAFAYGGNLGRPMYDPGIKPETHNTFKQYKASKSTTLNHFYEKLLLLKGRMNTKTGKKIAKNRDAVMRKYLSEFFREWEGKDL